jgi:hypothetical protein
VATINGCSDNGKTIALRADMDALPIQEENQSIYTSKNAGIMHACGHDFHTASLLGTAKVLLELKNYWSGTVNRKWYNEFSMDLHVIGGMFGGHRDTWDRVVNLFEKYTEDILKEDKGLPAEENVMSLMYYNHKELFVTKYFETWWHEDNYHSFFGNQTQDVKNNYFENTKSFYKILEELKNYYE